MNNDITDRIITENIIAGGLELLPHTFVAARRCA